MTLKVLEATKGCYSTKTKRDGHTFVASPGVCVLMFLQYSPVGAHEHLFYTHVCVCFFS